jgi:hypothetical protein
VGSVIVQNDVDVQIVRNATLNFPKEAQKLLMTVAVLALGNDMAIDQINAAKSVVVP